MHKSVYPPEKNRTRGFARPYQEEEGRLGKKRGAALAVTPRAFGGQRASGPFFTALNGQKVLENLLVIVNFFYSTQANAPLPLCQLLAHGAYRVPVAGFCLGQSIFFW